MLIQGGVIRRGRRNTALVRGAYWMIWQTAFSAITLPGVSAMSRPTSKAASSACRSLRLPWPAAMSSANIAMPRARFAPFEASVSR